MNVSTPPHPLRSHPIHVPGPISAYPLSPLSSGPAGYVYTPVSSRPLSYESLRYKHGVRFVRQDSLRGLVLRWCAEDVKPVRVADRMAAVLLPPKKKKKKKKEGVFSKFKRWAGSMVAAMR
jgi:hypothetical protein